MYTRSMASGRRVTKARKMSTAASVDDVVDEIYRLRPNEFTLRKLLDFYTNSPVLGKFLIIQKVRESLATPFEDVVAEVCKLSQQLELRDEEEPKLPLPDDPCLSMHIAVIFDDPDSLSGIVLFHVIRIFNALQRSVELYDCERDCVVGMACGVWTDLVDLLAPVEDRPLRISSLLPAIEWLKQHPDGIVLAEFRADTRKREMWMRRWHKWLTIVDECWAIKKYLDPFYVFLEEADGAIFAEVVKSTNENFAHASPRLPEPAQIDVNPRYGSAPLRLRRFASLPEATQVASALRTHLSVPGSQDGSCALAARICTFSCYNMIWW
ncbi:hypothetical protein MPTK1_1g22940 [Marchantia polymorpha subsp. ruderalis]|uniref:Uncharacterized protein n=4 Tax=Marchantia polymorpha TaxID=3197 RepID=A0AAF6ATA2_MARPO|nr:hypothetical protein MARPO_0065s0082 [Marchantia polymorpha]BBM99671.1 hypothetical protein Mp_1g22940 [Marchantia polymorpha subsp. ruderalis]PTQ36284.1 hypothetical protein MARPO_0065s0082 [Marchantia polymorpha]PTQ36285.1 hypothetical protein MARPO_0065s0082 [Marchantia polymorpha]BBM99672.1 hypothetical protein Mp_1g22940 [Marchantia polymorpha subsp. ruderalis]|eukprot:PTQ36283.1 hypothetical protein MARPO_0065s0082 [Marchantia polymorpha]